MAGVRGYELFDVTLLRRQALSPALGRFTFGGPDVARMKTCAADQRIKIFFPDAAGRTPSLPHEGWQALYQALDPAKRWPRRTYTIRQLAHGELDIDFVLHGASGPASRWAIGAVPGDRLQIVAPNAAFAGDPGGYEWRPPQKLERLLLIADETALPAVAGILEGLAGAAPRGEVFLEVPSAEDRIALAAWPGLALHWLPRGDGEPGRLMVEAARKAALPKGLVDAGTALPDVDPDGAILWDVSAAGESGFYAWVAGEAAAVKDIRSLLIQERGLDRRCVNLMGYWRNGRALE